jgi:hypothetical protein
MGVVEGEGAGLVQRGGVADGAGSGEEQQRRKASAVAGLLRTERSDLAREDSQH